MRRPTDRAIPTRGFVLPPKALWHKLLTSFVRRSVWTKTNSAPTVMGPLLLKLQGCELILHDET